MSPTCPVCDFFLSHLTGVYFVYGLAFFTTGIVAWLEATRHSKLRLARTLPFLAAFGLAHGTYEWLKMFERMASSPILLPPRLSRLVVLILSFALLLEFGLSVASLTGGRRWRLVRWVVLFLFLVGSAMIGLRWVPQGQAAWVPALDAWCRYSLAIPGSALAAWGLQRYVSQRKGGEEGLSCDLQVVALALLLYGIPGQVFVDASPLPPSTVVNSEFFMRGVHIPIQLFRTLMAILVVTFTARGVRCFEQGRLRRLDRLNRDRLRAQRKLTKEMAECRRLERQLLHRTVQAQEEERRYIARELHDETAQALTALSLGLGNAEAMVDENDREARLQLRELRDLVEDMMKDVNQLTSRLRPPVLDDLGLIPALITYGDKSDRHLPFRLHVEVTGHRRRLPAEVETNLYRIAQESLTNVARHAQADHAAVHLHLGAEEVILTVSDDGIGMRPERADEAAARGDGWGLAGIHERARLLGGVASIHSEPGAGTEIEVRIPNGVGLSDKGASEGVS